MKTTLRLRVLETLSDRILVTPMHDEILIDRPANYDGGVLVVEIETEDLKICKYGSK